MNEQEEDCDENDTTATVTPSPIEAMAALTTLKHFYTGNTNINGLVAIQKMNAELFKILPTNEQQKSIKEFLVK